MLLVSLLHQSGGVWQVCAQQTEKSHAHITSAGSCQVYSHVLQFSIYRVYFFNIWFGMVQRHKEVGCREGKKLVKIY